MRLPWGGIAKPQKTSNFYREHGHTPDSVSENARRFFFVRRAVIQDYAICFEMFFGHFWEENLDTKNGKLLHSPRNSGSVMILPGGFYFPNLAAGGWTVKKTLFVLTLFLVVAFAGPAAAVISDDRLLEIYEALRPLLSPDAFFTIGYPCRGAHSFESNDIEQETHSEKERVNPESKDIAP